MSWYFVTKKIKGFSYLYLQRTWRDGKRPRTDNRYISAGSAGRPQRGTVDVSSDDPESPQSVPVVARRVLYHGSRGGFTGRPQVSKTGRFGAGLYVSNLDTAELYATYDPKTVARLHEYDDAKAPEPDYDGEVLEFDISKLRILTVRGERGYHTLLNRMLGAHRSRNGGYTDALKEELRQALEEHEYDGIEIEQDRKTPYQMVLFESALGRIYESIEDDDTVLSMKND